MKSAQKNMKLQTTLVLAALALLFFGFIALAAVYGNYCSSQKSGPETEHSKQHSGYSFPSFTPIVRTGGI